MQSENNSLTNSNQLHQINLDYSQSNLYETLKANHADQTNPNSEQNIVYYLDTIHKNLNKIEENFHDIESSIKSSLAIVEPNNTQNKNKANSNTKNVQFNKKLLYNVGIFGSIVYLPWVIGNFYFANNSSSCQLNTNPSFSLSGYLKINGILSVVFIVGFSLIFIFGGCTRESYNQASYVKIIYHIFSMMYGMGGIDIFLNHLKEFSTCSHSITTYFVASVIAHICYFCIYFSHLIELR
jgi:hypothetical protein